MPGSVGRGQQVGEVTVRLQAVHLGGRLEEQVHRLHRLSGGFLHLVEIKDLRWGMVQGPGGEGGLGEVG